MAPSWCWSLRVRTGYALSAVWVCTWACSPAAVATFTERAASLRSVDEDGDEGTIDTAFGAFDPLFGAQLPWEEGAPEAYYHQAPGEAVRADCLVQFVGPIGSAARAFVQGTGARTVGFFPHNALVVAATDAQREALLRGAAVRAVVPVPPLLRVHASLFHLLPGSHGAADEGPAHLNVAEPIDVLVEVDEPTSLGLVAEALASTASTVVPESIPAPAGLGGPPAEAAEQDVEDAEEQEEVEEANLTASRAAGASTSTENVFKRTYLAPDFAGGDAPAASTSAGASMGREAPHVAPVNPAAHASASELSRALHVRLDAQGLARLARMAEVVTIAPYPKWTLLNERSSGLIQSGRPAQRRLQALGLDGRGQVVAVADTGLDTKSCHFRGDNKVVDYQHFVAGKPERGDGHGHGTHVAGSIAGDDKKGRFCGMAPKASLVVQQCAGVGGEMAELGSNAAPMLARAWHAGARVHTNSWGIEGAAYTPVVRAVDRFVYEHPEMVVVVATGNLGEDGPGTVYGPASGKNVVAVGAYNGQCPERVAQFSSQGPTDDGRIKPLVLAPGVDVTSARTGGRCRTQTMSGTSMAAPLVAGGVALVRQYFVEGRYGGGGTNFSPTRTPSAALIKAVLLVGAEPIDVGLGREPVPDAWQQGFGRLRLDRSLGFDGGRRLWVSDQEVALDTGERWEACFDVAAGAAVDVALSWIDPPPKREGAAVALTHNLDLQLVDATGRFARGNEGLHGDVVATLPDELNVEEVIRRRNLPAGVTCVRVIARQAPERPQPFAIAVLAPRVGDVRARRLPP